MNVDPIKAARAARAVKGVLVDQPTPKTNRKVKAASAAAVLGAAVATVAVSYLPEAFQTPEMTEYVAGAVIAGVTGLSTWVGGYFARERAQ